MQLLAVGLDHHTAPLALRERVALGADALAAAASRYRERGVEGFVISTCNRTEYYGIVGHAESGRAFLSDLLFAGSGLDSDDLGESLNVYSHREAVRHLFRVAAGMESMVPGEDQIVGQVKAALDAASREGMLGATTRKLGAAALAAGKRVRAKTGLSRHPLSVVSVACHAAREALGSLSNTHVLIVGAGATAELTLKHLGAHGPASITVTGRRDDRVAVVAGAVAARTAPWDALGSAVRAADLVISCTSSPDVIFTSDVVAEAMRGREARPLFVFDLAVPRDVEPSVAAIPFVRLWDVDALQAICDANRALRAGEFRAGELIVDAETERFMEWWDARRLAPTITALLDASGRLRDAELEKLLARMPGLAERDEQLIIAFASKLVQKLLHGPISVMKQSADGDNMAQVVRTLFDLDVEASSRARSSQHVADQAHAPPHAPHA